ncbi:MAG TPA: histidine phosphatase family protein [Noviherbaspirillum sp.]|uniref:histidine phosphatase family protein n=1 Tax=Noviherbaspirillum sp. TaxID=1926288 RepID=UPI002D589B02|nr:histidine phosphatase family protein [Noviherbaspirillum sp.]HYD94966.1 histidine phosphatase family protein [Noviherbaspirillum sp.]
MRHLVIGLLTWLLGTAACADDALWKQLAAGGYVLLMRHAQTEPGVGDPPGFTLGDCSTQRNLSGDGRAQAARTGEAFRARGIRLDEVRSSAWCRCTDTATLAFGRASVWPALNSLFDAPEKRETQSAQVLALAAGVSPPRNLMLVTHQVNITALTGEAVASGEIIIARPARKGRGLTLVGRLKVP